jgi:hypothetical protein
MDRRDLGRRGDGSEEEELMLRRREERVPVPARVYRASQLSLALAVVGLAVALASAVSVWLVAILIVGILANAQWLSHYRAR